MSGTEGNRVRRPYPLERQEMVINIYSLFEK